MFRRAGTVWAMEIALPIMFGLGGCVLAPSGTSDERAKIAASSRFETPIEARELPELSSEASWRDVLSRAFLANGELESAYFEWKAAFARIDQAAVWPNSNVTLSFSYLFSPENVKAWNRTTLGVGFDPAMNLAVPVKVRSAGKIALDAAREAGEKFRAAKFDLQQKVLSAYFELALSEELGRIDRDNIALLKLLVDSASTRAEAGGPLQDLIKALIESETAENDLATLRAKAASTRSALNAMLGRAADAPLNLPPTLPEPRPVIAEDSRLIAVAVAQNPELAALAHRVAGRRDAVELARLAYLPDFSPSASVTGSVSKSLGTMVMLPTRVPAIRAAIGEAQAMQASSEAVLRQSRQDRAASLVANLYLMRNAERQIEWYRERVLPAARELVSSSRSAYAAGSVAFSDLVDSERMLLTMRRMLAEVQIEREQRLVDLETLAGVDIETLGPTSDVPEQSPPVHEPDPTPREIS